MPAEFTFLFTLYTHHYSWIVLKERKIVVYETLMLLLKSLQFPMCINVNSFSLHKTMDNMMIAARVYCLHYNAKVLLRTAFHFQIICRSNSTSSMLHFDVIVFDGTANQFNKSVSTSQQHRSYRLCVRNTHMELALAHTSRCVLWSESSTHQM